MKKRKKLLFLLIIAAIPLGIICYLTGRLYFSYLNNIDAINEVLPATYVLPPEVTKLFSLIYTEKLEVKEIRNSKVRNPLSILSYDKKYAIAVYEINVKPKDSLDYLLHWKRGRREETTGSTYIDFGVGSLYNFHFKAGGAETAGSMHISIWGDSINYFKHSTNIHGFRLLCKSFSISYSETDPVDIFLSGKENTFGSIVSIPTEIIFYQREKSVFLLIMTPEDKDINIPEGLLFRMLQ